MKKFSAVWDKKAYRPGSANFESYKLCFWRNTIKVKPTGKLLCFYGIFAFIGLFFMLVPCFAQNDSVDSIGAVVFFGLIFLAAGLWGITRAVRRNYPVIDFNSDMF